MVQFGKDRFTIEVYTGTNPAEEYTDLMKELTFLLGTVTPDNSLPDGFYNVCNLLYNLVPELEDAKKMVE